MMDWKLLEEPRTEHALAKAIWNSLFCDARLPDDVALPAGDDDRRGWWADILLDGDTWGSLVWQHERGRLLPAELRSIEDAAATALQWLVDDHIASRITVTAEQIGQAALITVGLHREAAPPTFYRFESFWEAD